MAAKELAQRPVAGADSVEDLVAKVLRGEVRIPVFQRGIKWESKEVVELFDSIYRGYPIGSLLLRLAPADASEVKLGPLVVMAPETQRALWVVDGQQRLTSLAAGLGRDGELPRKPIDQFVVYFDPRDESFHSAPADGVIADVWVPLPRLLDATHLSEWIFGWRHGHDARLRTIIFEAGKRLREYKVPHYIIETPDDDVARQIFDRVNSTGKRLERKDVFDALFGNKAAAPTLSELAHDLGALGMGMPDEQSQVLPSLVAMRGLDVTRPFGQHARAHPEDFEGIASEALPVLRRALGFLRTHAAIPHLRLLPYSAPLVALARFFAVHPEPNPRTQTLLVRWVWRMFFSPGGDDRTLRRRSVAAIVKHDEEASVQSLLELVDHRATPFSLPARFDARAAGTKLVLLGLNWLKPREIADDHQQRGQLVDVAGLVNELDLDAFRQVFPGSGDDLSSPANRMLLRGQGSARRELAELVAQRGTDDPILRAHAIDRRAADALIVGDAADFVAARSATIAGTVDDLATRLAEWERSDRPSIEYLLARIAGA